MHEAFEAEVLSFEPDVPTELLAVAKLLADHGPHLADPTPIRLKDRNMAT
ncbi:hypothetical protein [Mesorhizobium sp. M0915]